MKFVDPIRDPKKISQIKNLLRGQGNIRDLLLFTLGINAALRISDLLSLRVRDLFESDLTIRDNFEIQEKKTGKTNRITITPKVKETLQMYASVYSQIVQDKDNFVFFQKKTYPLGSKPIWRKMSWVLLSNIGKDVGLKSIAWHSLRKTWWLHARLNGIPMEIVQEKLQHSNAAVTRRYLGITSKEVEDACNKLDL